MANAQQLRNATQAASRNAAMPQRGGLRLWPLVLMGAGMAVAFIPGVGGAISHVFDRWKNKSDSNHELKLRTKYYSNQIGATLGISPDRVSVKDFQTAAGMNPELGRLYREVTSKEKRENDQSLLISGGVTAASLMPVPGMGAAAKVLGEATTATKVLKGGVEMAKVMGASVGGGAIFGALAKEDMSAQDLIEAMDKGIQQADAAGVSRREVVNPQWMLMVRVAQDELLRKEIKDKHKKHLHHMNPQEVQAVVAAEPKLQALMNATTREAEAVVNGDLNIREIGAMAPNLRGGFTQQVGRSANDNIAAANDHAPSMVEREMARRQAAAMQVGNRSQG